MQIQPAMHPKITLLVPALGFCCVFATAQVTLWHTSDSPLPGVDYMLYENDTTSAQPGPDGAGVSWDFSSEAFTYAPTYHYIDPASTAEADSFPGATVAKNYFSHTDYYHYDSTGGNNLGYTEVVVPTHFGLCTLSDPEVVMVYPFSLSSSFTDFFSGHCESDGVPVEVEGFTQVEALGEGSLITPQGTYPAAIKVHRYRFETDSFSVFGNPMRDTIISHRWEWYVPGLRLPAFEIRIDSLNDDPPMKKTVWMGTATTGIQVAVGLQQGLHIVSNPSAGSLSLRFQATTGGTVHLQLSDGSGRLLANLDWEVNAGANQREWSSLHLPAGIYYLSAQMNGQLSVVKWVNSGAE